MSLEVADSAVQEMTINTDVGSFGQDFTVSIPAQLRFVDEPTQNTRRFHVELKRRGYASLDPDPTRRHQKAKPMPIYYNGEICSRDHYKRMSVKMMRGNVVRLYPNDGWDVQPEELADIIEAIEAGFGATLEHDPIDRESETNNSSDKA